MRHLAWTNLKRHRHSTLIGAVAAGVLIALAYAVGALIDMRPLMHATGSVLEDSRLMPAVMTLAWILLLIFIVAFLIYLNTLLLARRTEELDMYRLLGMPSSRLGGVLIWEALMTGAAALVIGLVGGVLLSKLLAMALVRLMGFQTAIGIQWSLQIAGQLIGLFLLVYLIVGAVNAAFVRTLGHQRGRRAEAQHLPPRLSGWQVVLACAGMLLVGWSAIGTGNYFAWVRPLRQLTGLPGWGQLGLLTFCGILGTYLVFRQSLPAAAFLLARWRVVRRHAKWLLAANTLYQRWRRDHFALWLITLLSTLTIAVLGSAAMLLQLGQREVENSMPLPITASVSNDALVEKKAAGLITRQAKVTTKRMVGKTTLRRQGRDDTTTTLYQVMRLSDYQRIRQWQPNLPALQVAPGQAALVLSDPAFLRRGPAQRLVNAGRQITFPADGRTLAISDLTTAFPLGSAIYFDRGLVVADSDFEAMRGVNDPLAIYWLKETAAGHRVEQQLDDQTQIDYVRYDQAVRKGSKLPTMTKDTDDSFSRSGLNVRRPMARAVDTLFGFAVFITLLMGGAVLVATACILLLKQVTHAQGRAPVRRVLWQLGMPTSQLTGVAYVSTFGVYLAPLVFASLNAFVIVHFIASATAGQTGGLVLVVWAIYSLVDLAFAWLAAQLTDRYG
ncbi:ABC transporter permease [Lacticaseibacillus mingshuiensis]|uniref:FtsX-like permease family protein n=1 Tax=Lacticaseibacillus mingshuiensis TaxID=2799574 RepID=A0ABW4CHF9_9LACO|nr:ABC transporter permease [Lacticaseibacillus mingshuiensis]